MKDAKNIEIHWALSRHGRWRARVTWTGWEGDVPRRLEKNYFMPTGDIVTASRLLFVDLRESNIV